MGFMGRRSNGQPLPSRRSGLAAVPSKHLAFDELESRIALSASSLILDVNTYSGSSSPTRLVSTGEQVFFAANDIIHGQELWRTDGTEEGTRLVRDFNVGTESSNFSLAANLNGKLVFIKIVPNNSSLWISDGTSEGTTLLADDIVSSEARSNDSPLASGVVLDNVLYFLANRTNEVGAIWRTDGTAEGTWAVEPTRDLSPADLFIFDGKIFFSGRSPGSLRGLWASDGTSEGTAQINAAPFGPSGTGIGEFAELDGLLYFTAVNNSVANAGGVWRTDGTADGTFQVYDSESTIFPFVEPQLVSYEGSLYFNNKLTFPGTTIAPIRVLWKINGDGAESAAVTGPSGDYLFNARSFTKSQGLLFFAATAYGGTELWRTDGTTSGTFVPNDPTPGGAVSTNPWSLISVNDRLYFTGDRIGGGTRISSVWTSDGTTEGTVELYSLPSTLNPAESSGDRPMAGLSNGNVIFAGQNLVDGLEPWITDGTAAGTRLLANVNDLTRDGVGSGVTVGNLLYFTATSPGGRTLNDLWVTDGTSDGTRKVDFELPNGDAISPKELASVDEKLVFINRLPTASGNIQEFLVVSDGTTDGTTILFEGREVYLNDRFRLRGVGASRLAFYGIAPDGRSGLWFTDLTPSGTFHWASVAPVSRSVELLPGYVTVNGFTYVVVRMNENTYQLWRTDGTPGGTTKASSADFLYPDTSGINVNPLQVIGDKIYYLGHDNVTANIYETDGTVTGTRVIFQTQQRRFFSQLQNLTAFQGSLYFTFASSPIRADQLWRVDVASMQSTLLGDLDQLSGFAVAGDKLYFTYSLGNQVQLGVTDGTPQGTRLLSQRYGRINYGGIVAKMEVGGLLVFSTDDPHGQNRILVSDGTDEGTYPLVDLFPIYGPEFESRGPVYNLFHVDNRIIYANSNYKFGRELYRIDFIPPKLTVDGAGITAPNDVNEFTLLVKDLADRSPNRIYTFDIDWNGDGQVDETLTGPSGTIARHQFDQEGQFLVRFSVKTPEGVVGQTVERTIRSSRELQVEISTLPSEVVSSEEVPITIEVRGDLVPASGPLLVGIDVNEDNVIDFQSFGHGRRATATIAVPLGTLNPNGGVQQMIRNVKVMAYTTAGVASANQNVLVTRMRREFENGEWTFTVGTGDADVAIKAGVDEGNRATFVITDQRGFTWNTGSENQLAGNLVIYDGPNSHRIDVSTYTRNTTIYGGAGSDTILGSAQADVIYGDSQWIEAKNQNGNDLINGGAGDDLIVGDGAEGSQSRNTGADTIFGGEGNDTIYGDETTVDGGEGGNDLLHGDADDDLIDARSGHDTAYGGEGQDTIIGVIDSDLINFTSARSNLGGIAKSVTPTSLATPATVITKQDDATYMSASPVGRSLLTDIALAAWNTREWSDVDDTAGEESTLDPWETGLEEDLTKRSPTRAGRRTF